MGDGHRAGGRFANAYGQRTVHLVIRSILGERGRASPVPPGPNSRFRKLNIEFRLATGRNGRLGRLNPKFRLATGRNSSLGMLNVEFRLATGRNGRLGRLNTEFGFGRRPESRQTAPTSPPAVAARRLARRPLAPPSRSPPAPARGPTPNLPPHHSKSPTTGLAEASERSPPRRAVGVVAGRPATGSAHPANAGILPRALRPSAAIPCSAHRGWTMRWSNRVFGSMAV